MQQNLETKSLPTDKFLTVAVNLLNNGFLEATRTEAKRIYREIEGGKTVPLTHLEMEDKSLVRFDVALNHELYRGTLSFSSFRTGLRLLLSNAAQALKEPEKLRTFRNEQDPNSMMFGVFAVTAEANQPSVLVLGAESGRGDAAVRLQLTYLDSAQFEENLPPEADANEMEQGGEAV